MIPQHKHDFEAIKQLQVVTSQQIVPLLPELLKWIQDMNWPVAEPVLEILMQYPTEITPLVEEVLLGNDEMWIYWCLERIVPRLPFYSKIVLANAVEQIATSVDPEMGELADLAKTVLRSFEP